MGHGEVVGCLGSASADTFWAGRCCHVRDALGLGVEFWEKKYYRIIFVFNILKKKEKIFPLPFLCFYKGDVVIIRDMCEEAFFEGRFSVFLFYDFARNISAFWNGRRIPAARNARWLACLLASFFVRTREFHQRDYRWGGVSGAGTWIGRELASGSVATKHSRERAR